MFVIQKFHIIQLTPIMNIIKNGNIGDNLHTLANILLYVIIYYEYIKFAKAVAKLAE